jgi:TRAP-type C4-dicarboxylate transport system permease small subunit
MNLFRARYGLVLEWVVMALMVILFAEVTLGVIFRAAGSSLVWYDEVASILLAWLTFYGSALASVKRAHIGCPEVVQQMSAGAQQAFAMVVQVLVIGFFALLAWVGFTIMPILAGDSLVSLPWVPMNFVMSVVPVSSLLIIVAEAMTLVDLVRHREVHAQAGGIALADGTH